MYSEDIRLTADVLNKQMDNLINLWREHEKITFVM